MAQQPSFNVENNFSGGLITTATGLNFPPNACTETYNCEFDWDGAVTRRLGFDFETGYETKDIQRSAQAITSYLWKNVAGNGDISLAVLQVGLTVYFYKIVLDQSYSSGAVVSNITLTPVSGAVDPEVKEAQFSDGNGYLFITHPSVNPIRVSYNSTTEVVTGTSLSLKLRDFEGAVADPNAVDNRPTETFPGGNSDHKYNLFNQGWTSTNLTAWDTAQTTMPSNADVMWQFVDSSNNFDASTASINRITAGNTPAPKGHFILTIWNQDRGTASGIGVGTPTSTTSGSERPSTSSFFAGRVFYAGINYSKFNSNIYFTQIIERDDQYEKCYQLNDPTSRDLFDLLPSDGGVIVIPEAGTIKKLMAVPGGLAVFAENGVWFVTGSTGIGFAANDYTVQKLSNIPTLTASSFVNVSGYPSWWNSEGIYILTPGGQPVAAQGNAVLSQGGLPAVQSLTDSKIWSFFKEVPLESKKYAKGIYHYQDRHIRWIYKSESTTDVTTQYEYDRVLNFNVITGAFYPWSITDSDVKVNALIISDTVSGNVSVDDVVDGANLVVDASSNQVITFSSTAENQTPFDKYIVSYPSAGSYKFTFASKTSSSYIDWFTYDLEERSYDSYLITGYRIRGGTIRKSQDNWTRIFSEMDTQDAAYYFQGIWDYATTGSGTGRWSSRQLVEHPLADYSTVSKRLKLRGHGLALQFKISSFPQKPFRIVGWATLSTTNNLP
jgi:hypothetical protein